MEFEWDLSKESENICKHGVPFIEALSCFSDPNAFQIFDSEHSVLERRYFWIGKSSTGRIVTTRFTYRNEKIRIIGCAEWRKFKRLYYETTKS